MARKPYKKVARVREPVPGGTPIEHRPPPEDLGHDPIPKERYTSEAFMKLEWQKMWSKVWLLGCLRSDLAEPGDYVCTEIGHESVILVCQPDMSVRAFFNVCPHRGNRLVNPGMDNIETFKCSYHGWEYAPNGKFVRVPNGELFPQGLPTRGMFELPCAEWIGLVWFSLDPQVMPFAEYMAPILGHLEPYQFERMVLTRDVSVEWNCNWKTSVDAFNETYHVRATHPQLSWYLNDMDVQIDCYDRHSRYLVPFGMLSPAIPRAPDIPPPLKAMLTDAGLDPASYSGPIDGIRETVQKTLREHAAAEGRDYSMLNDDQLTDDYNYLVFPNLTFNTHADHVMIFRHRPHPSDPNKMIFDTMTLSYIVDEEEIPEYRPRHRTYKSGEKSLGMVIDQDGSNLPRVQAGMNSDAYRGLWLGDLEVRIRHFHKTLDDYIGDAAKDYRFAGS